MTKKTYATLLEKQRTNLWSSMDPYTWMCQCWLTCKNLEDRTGGMDDWDRWRYRVREIHASCATWWWWFNTCVFIINNLSLWKLTIQIYFGRLLYHSLNQIKEKLLKGSEIQEFRWWHHICCWWLCQPTESKHCNTNRRNVWAAKGTMLKNKPKFSHILWMYLSQPVDFSDNLHI